MRASCPGALMHCRWLAAYKCCLALPRLFPLEGPSTLGEAHDDLLSNIFVSLGVPLQEQIQQEDESSPPADWSSACPSNAAPPAAPGSLLLLHPRMLCLPAWVGVSSWPACLLTYCCHPAWAPSTRSSVWGIHPLSMWRMSRCGIPFFRRCHCANPAPSHQLPQSPWGASPYLLGISWTNWLPASRTIHLSSGIGSSRPR